MIKLVKFKEYLDKDKNAKSGPPISIKASDLDKNFSMLQIAEGKKGIYKTEIDEQHGTTLVFKANNVEVGWQEINVCQNGSPKKMTILATEPY